MNNSTLVMDSADSINATTWSIIDTLVSIPAGVWVGLAFVIICGVPILVGRVYHCIADYPANQSLTVRCTIARLYQRPTAA